MSALEPENLELEDTLRPARPVLVRGYGRIAARGIVWVFLLAASSKGMGFIAQLVLGWLLSKNDYAVYALAISVTNLLGTARDGGLSKILVQRGKEYQSLASPVLQMAVLFNLFCAALLLATAPFAKRFYNVEELPPLLWVMGLTYLLSTPAMVFQARLLIDLRFGKTVRISTGSMILNYSGMIVLAWLGFGPMSFVLPSTMVAVYESIAFGLAAGFIPHWERLTRRLFMELLQSSVWLMLAMLATTLITQADYLVIGKLQREILGSYFFGCQLSIGFAAILALGIRWVLMPILARFSDHDDRFGSAYLYSIRTLTFIFTPVCVIAAILSPPLVEICWQGKWDDAIPVVVIMTLGLTFRMLTPVALAGLEARGRWRLQAVLLWADAMGTVIAAWLGCLIGGLVEVSVCISIERAIMAMAQCIAVGRISRVGFMRILAAMMPPILVCAACGAVGYVIVQAAMPAASSWLRAVVFAALFVVLFGVGTGLRMRMRAQEVLKIAGSLRKSPQTET